MILLGLPGLVQSQTSGVISGELRRWHNVTITFDGPLTSETGNPNPFTDYRLNVTFSNGARSVIVPGYYAADGDAANSSAVSGNKWRVHFVPDTVGTWTYSASFRTGPNIAVNASPTAGTPTSFNGATGSFVVQETDKTGADFRAHGLLRYVGGHYYQFQGSGRYFLKGGADSPENLLGYVDFDGTADIGGLIPNFLHYYHPHLIDWRPGDPDWAGGRGRSLIGALNYLASQGMNNVYFLVYNIDGGDGGDTWPWTSSSERRRYDVSKLAQWEIAFSHMDRLGIQLHVVLHETENDGRLGGNGALNDTRKLYFRELVARFSHHLALVWNIGEENDNSNNDRRAFAQYIRELDPYDHPIALHSDENQADTFYNGLLGSPYFESASIQGNGARYNEWARSLRTRTASAGRAWAIHGDEQGPPVAADMSNLDLLRTQALWGNLMGGGAGVEWYFGYQDGFGDLQSEDWRVAEPLWAYTRHALNFFHTYLPFWQMTPNNALASGTNALTLAKPGEIYAVYLPSGTASRLPTLTLDSGIYSVAWYNPRTGGTPLPGSVSLIAGPGTVSLGAPPYEPAQDWVALVRSNPVPQADPNVNLVQNGDFSGGLAGWQFWNTTAQSFNGGLRVTKQSIGADGGFLQTFPVSLPSGAPLEMELTLSNPTSTPTMVMLMLRDTNWFQTRYCSFMVWPNVPAQVFRVRGLTGAVWPNIAAQIWLGDGILDVDNVSVKYIPDGGFGTIQCAVLPPPETELVFNGSFDAGLESWAFWNVQAQVVGGVLELGRWPALADGGFYQWNPYSTAVGTTLELSLRLGNRSSQPRVLHLLLRNPDWSDQRSCWITLPPNTPLQPYVMRIQTAQAWPFIVLQGWLQQSDAAPTLLLDDISLRHRPGLALSGNLECPTAGFETVESAPLPPVSGITGEGGIVAPPEEADKIE